MIKHHIYIIIILLILVILFLQCESSKAPVQEIKPTEKHEAILDLPPSEEVDEILELPADNELLTTAEDLILDSITRYYEQILQNDNQYHAVQLKNCLKELEQLPETNTKVVEIKNKLALHERNYFKYGLLRKDYKHTIYQVRYIKGNVETVYSVAKKFKTSVKRLCEYNPLDIIIRQRDAKDNISNAAWKKNKNGKLPQIDIYYKK